MYSLGPDHTTAALVDEVERNDHFIHSVDFSPTGAYIYWTETGKTSTNKYTMGSMRRAALVDLTTSTALNAKGGDVRHTHDGLMLTIGNLAVQVYTVTDTDDATPTVSATITPYIGQGKLLSHMALQPVIITNTVPVKERVLGHKHYELVDHLGNVRAVVSDMKYATWSGTAFEDYHAQVESRADYYAFGSLMPGRHSSTESYRFGFNGKENDNEMHTAPGTSVDFGARMYDARIGRFLCMDDFASQRPMNSPYGFAGNTPIWAVDVNGDSIILYGEAEAMRFAMMLSSRLGESYNIRLQLVNASDTEKLKQGSYYIMTIEPLDNQKNSKDEQKALFSFFNYFQNSPSKHFALSLAMTDRTKTDGSVLFGYAYEERTRRWQPDDPDRPRELVEGRSMKIDAVHRTQYLNYSLLEKLNEETGIDPLAVGIFAVTRNRTLTEELTGTNIKHVRTGTSLPNDEFEISGGKFCTKSPDGKRSNFYYNENGINNK